MLRFLSLIFSTGKKGLSGLSDTALGRLAIDTAITFGIYNVYSILTGEDSDQAPVYRPIFPLIMGNIQTEKQSFLLQIFINLRNKANGEYIQHLLSTGIALLLPHHLGGPGPIDPEKYNQVVDTLEVDEDSPLGASLHDIATKISNSFAILNIDVQGDNLNQMLYNLGQAVTTSKGWSQMASGNPNFSGNNDCHVCTLLQTANYTEGGPKEAAHFTIIRDLVRKTTSRVFNSQSSVSAALALALNYACVWAVDENSF